MAQRFIAQPFGRGKPDFLIASNSTSRHGRRSTPTSRRPGNGREISYSPGHRFPRRRLTTRQYARLVAGVTTSKTRTRNNGFSGARIEENEIPACFNGGSIYSSSVFIGAIPSPFEMHSNE